MKIGLVRMVAAEVLGEEPDDRVVDDVDGEDLAVERLLLQEEEEDGEIEEIEDGLVELDRMERRVEGDARSGRGRTRS